MKKETVILILLIIGVLGFMYLANFPIENRPYINRFGNTCDQNFTQEYGAFRSCGELMSEDTARFGLMYIFIGLPLLSFVILPLLLKIKRSRQK